MQLKNNTLAIRAVNFDKLHTMEINIGEGFVMDYDACFELSQGESKTHRTWGVPESYQKIINAGCDRTLYEVQLDPGLEQAN